MTVLPLCPAPGPALRTVDRDERDVDPASAGGVDCEGSLEGDQVPGDAEWDWQGFMREDAGGLAGPQRLAQSGCQPHICRSK